MLIKRLLDALQESQRQATAGDCPQWEKQPARPLAGVHTEFMPSWWVSGLALWSWVGKTGWI